MSLARPRPLAAALVLLGVSLHAGAGGRDALAVFTDTEAASASLGVAAVFGGTTYYLHNSPTPPTADTAAQANLAMNVTRPTATTLFNYDTDQDSAPGRLVARGGSGAGETILARYQNWRGPAAPLFGQAINGTVTVEFWSAVAGFTQGVSGEVRVFLRDRDTVTGIALELANATVSRADWQGGNAGWVKASAAMSVNALLLVGHQLEVKLVVPSTSGGDIMLAYDTATYPSRVRLP